LVPEQKCHPDRSEAQWRDLLFLFRFGLRGGFFFFDPFEVRQVGEP
jgi:hypothetical protein